MTDSEFMDRAEILLKAVEASGTVIAGRVVVETVPPKSISVKRSAYLGCLTTGPFFMTKWMRVSPKANGV